MRLVERTTREMTFTPAGRRFSRSARELLAGFETALAQLHDDSEVPLRLGWAWAGLGRHTVPLLHEWKQNHEGTIEINRPGDPVEAIRRGDIDAALVRRTALSSEPCPTWR